MSDNPIRVLLVDDEEELVDFLGKRLIRKGFAVKSVTSGKAALKAMDSATFDVVVLDLKMPEMDGLQVLKAIKQDAPFTQAIMLTGHGSIELALQSGKSDAYKFLSKPADFEELVEVITEAQAFRLKALHDAYQEELQGLFIGSVSPHEIIAETKRLRSLYEQE